MELKRRPMRLSMHRENKGKVVAWDRIELTTRGFSVAVCQSKRMVMVQCSMDT
jgi:hypothetical protein